MLLEDSKRVKRVSEESEESEESERKRQRKVYFCKFMLLEDRR